MKTLIFDTETTGLPIYEAPLDKQPRIIELGGMIHDPATTEVGIAQYTQLVHPGCDITAEITKITGITNEDLIWQPDFITAWNGGVDKKGALLLGFKDFIHGCEVLIAHNAEFDVKLLSFELQRMELDPKDFIPPTVICTVAEFYHVFGRRAKLTELYERIINQPLRQTHRALDDVRALYEVCAKAGVF